jgi:endonuclease-3
MKKSEKEPNIDKIFTIFSKQNSEPKTELEYQNNYTLLVAVVLSAQSTDIGVNKATKKLFAIANNPEKMLKLGEEKLKKHINTIGLYNNKAKNIIALSKILVEKFDSEVPESLEILQSLPGVGRKTANVVLNCAFKHPTIAVDTHVF